MIPADLLLDAYMNAYFPMAEPSDGKLYWYKPEMRAIFKLESIKTPRSVRKLINSGYFEIQVDKNFEQVIRSCSNRADTWISQEIIESYINLYRLGWAHSVETYFNGELAGGLYGVAIGGAFFGESMFYKVSNASKVAFYALTERLRSRGYI
ncbi:MAG: leucyl/phenylalanyl-tRNA--protein transferase, partial [Bacteroidota bacterium]